MLGRGFPGENSLDAKPRTFSRRKHAGSLEALWVTRPEAVDLVGINHVERTNLMFRFLEKVQYNRRCHRSPVRFVVLKLDEGWSGWKHPKAQAAHPLGPSRRS